MQWQSSVLPIVAASTLSNKLAFYLFYIQSQCYFQVIHVQPEYSCSFRTQAGGKYENIALVI